MDERKSDWDWSSTARLEIRFPVEFLRAVDQWRRKQDDLPNRSEAVRRLVELGLKVKTK
jgi:Arc/MetJ-type ribon-helix-helix transcriptional regulator